MRTAIKSALVVLLGAVIATLGLLPAPAATSDAAKDECTMAEFQAGRCITAVVRGGEDPYVAGVQQAIDRGEIRAAQRFVEHRSKVRDDHVQSLIEERVSNAKAAEAAGRPVPTELDYSPTEPTTGDFTTMDTGAGYVLGSTHYMKDTGPYIYCDPYACAKVGEVAVEFRYTIQGRLSFSLAGEVWVNKGPTVEFLDLRCRTRYEQTLAGDLTVKTWSNCDDAQGPSAKSRALILDQDWTGGTIGKRYHPDYYVKFSPSVSSAEFSFSWRADSYLISTAGTTYWL